MTKSHKGTVFQVWQIKYHDFPRDYGGRVRHLEPYGYVVVSSWQPLGPGRNYHVSQLPIGRAERIIYDALARNYMLRAGWFRLWANGILGNRGCIQIPKPPYALAILQRDIDTFYRLKRTPSELSNSIDREGIPRNCSELISN